MDVVLFLIVSGIIIAVAIVAHWCGRGDGYYDGYAKGFDAGNDWGSEWGYRYGKLDGYGDGYAKCAANLKWLDDVRGYNDLGEGV